jgi:uncharacterized membrane protein SpoIIM required for sporulation
LAQVSTRTNDVRLTKYLNDLTAAAHSLIYLPPRRSALAGILLFISEGFGRAVARTWQFHLAATALFFGGALLAYFATLHDVLAAYALMPAEMAQGRLPGSTPEQLHEVLVSGREQGSSMKFAFASYLFSNNLRVGIMSLCLGVLAGVPTIFLMLYNGMIVGSLTALYHKAGIYGDYWAWIAPHAVSELTAIILCGGVGLLLGKAAISPGELTRTESLRRAGNEAAPICLGIAVMLVVAAIVESYLRQSHLSNTGRFLFTAGSAAFWTAYFAYGVYRERIASRTPVGSLAAEMGAKPA